MKKSNKVILHIMFWITIPLLIYYFKWVAQETSSLPGLPVPDSDSFIDIVQNNKDVTIVSLLGSIPVFYMSLYFLTPKLLFRWTNIKIAIYAVSLIIYIFAVVLITDLIFPMYYFFGIPYAVKVLIPIVILSGLGGTLAAFRERLQEK